jgi:peptidyl-prolyl cis-trans isomerase SurA
MSRGFFAVTLLLLTALVATPGRTEVVNRIVATIDGDPITAHELQRFVESKGEKAKNAPEKQVLEALITERLLDKEIQAQGIVVKDEEIDAYVGAIKAQNHLDDAGFVKALAGQGLTLKSYRERIKGELEKTQLVNREIRSRVTVSPEEIQRYYDEHKSEFATGEGAAVCDIFFAIPPGADAAQVAQIRARAGEVRDKAAGGGDFEALAKQYSQGPGADKGGLIGTFKKGEMTPELDEAVFKLKPKEVSPVVETDRGFHILKVDSISGEGGRSLNDVKDQIRDTLYGKELESRFSDWLSRDLRERHHVEVFN